MKIYVVTTGGLFLLLTVAHVWRIVVERALLGEPWYLLVTALTAVLTLWAGSLLWRTRRVRASDGG